MFHEGQQIGPYHLLRRLGRGGFGDVWLAEKRSQFLTKRVAVKLPHDDQVDFDTIQREARLWEEASGHPNVLPIIDAEVYDGQVVIVSEYADGGSLHDKLISVGSISTKDAVELTMGILSGLEFLHSKRIIHRDIKPQNILLQGGTPRLADFGISRAMATSGVSSTVIGTDAYMSPEAFDGKRTVETDVWSTGVVLYQLLNGSLPFPQTHPTERMFAVLTKEFEPLSSDVPNDLKRIVSTALAKLPENRFRSAQAMREALGHAKTQIDNPTFAKTEVIERGAIPMPVKETVDQPATVTRIDIPLEQETVVGQYGNSAPASTQLAFPMSTAEPQPNTRAVGLVAEQANGNSPELDTQNNSNTFIKLAMVGAAIVVGIMILVAIVDKLKSAGPTSNTTITKPAVAASSNGAVAANRSASNTTNTSVGNSNSSMARSPFCYGYIKGWHAGYTKVTGMNRGSDPPCPDESEYKDKSRDGGEMAGFVQGMTFARELNKSNSNK